MANRRAVESDPAFLHFREKHELADRTWEGYIIALQKYSDFNDLSLTELIEEAEKEDLDRVPMEKRKLGNRMRGFRRYLKNEGLAPTSIRGTLAAVKSFYKNGFSITVPAMGRDRDVQIRVREENKGIPAREDIIKALQVADIRERGIVLGITSSGLSASDLLTLTVREFREGYDSETGITVMDMRRKKTRQDFVTFFSAEATTAIDQYLRWRERPRPKTMHQGLVQAWSTHRIYTDKDYLFAKERIPASFLDTWNEELRRESEAGLQEVFRSLARRAGIARGKGTWNMFRAHKLRAWFYSTLLNTGCPMEYAELYMGHVSRLGSSAGTYYSAIVDKVKDVYLEYMPQLTLMADTRTNVIETKAYQELTAKIADLESALAMMEDEFSWRSQNPELAARRDRIRDEVKEEFRQRYGDHLTAEQRKERGEQYMRRCEEQQLFS